MSCPVLASLTTAVTAVEAPPVLTGLGAEAVLEEQVPVLADALAKLQRELAVRMAALERAATGASDVRGDAVRAGLDPRRAGLLRRIGVFTDSHRDIDRSWRTGEVRMEQIELLRRGAGKLPPGQRRRLIAEVLPLLPGLDEADTRRLVDFTVDQLAPGDPDDDEQTEHAARRLAWSRLAGGAVVFEGYLPAAEGAAFTAAVDALAESMRVANDGITPAQRRADGLTALIAAATEHGLPSGGGLPAALMLTVSLTEATRIAQRDPARHGRPIRLRPRGGSTIDREPVGDAAVRFGLCCAAITPILTDQTEPGGPHGWHGGPPPVTPPRASNPPGQRPGSGVSANAGTPPTQGLGVDAQSGAGSRPDPVPVLGAHPSVGSGPVRHLGDGGEPVDHVHPPEHMPNLGVASGGTTPSTGAANDSTRPATPTSLLARIAATPVQPLAVGRALRLATTAQRQALRLRDGGCVIPGCDIDATYTQPHHIIGWAIGGTTDLDQLVSLCWVHHRLTELGRFTFTPKTAGTARPPGSIEHPNWWITVPVKVNA